MTRLTMMDLYFECGDLRKQVRELEATISSLRKQIAKDHEWRREAGSGTYRCTGCGTRSTTPTELLLSCAEVREEGRIRNAPQRGAPVRS